MKARKPIKTQEEIERRREVRRILRAKAKSYTYHHKGERAGDGRTKPLLIIPGPKTGEHKKTKRKGQEKEHSLTVKSVSVRK